MAVTPGSRILAVEYNSLQNRIATVLGIGTGSYGYGQTVSSAPINVSATVTADRLKKLRDDISRAYTHQTGNTLNLGEINVGDVVGAEQSGTDLIFDGSGGYVFDNADTTKGFLDYLAAMSGIEANRLSVVLSQQEYSASVRSDSRTNSWSYVTITSEMDVDFGTANARRNFFNAGSSLEISGVVTKPGAGSASFTRNQGWQQIIQNPGRVVLSKGSVMATGSGATGVTFPQGTLYGNDNITSAYSEIFRKKADAGVYTNSYWSIDVRQISSSKIRFRVKLNDGGPESDLDGTAQGSVYGGVKEPVTADITMRFGGKRPAGAVDLPFPAFSVIKSFQ